MVTSGNAYLLEKETKREPCNRGLLKNVGVYITKIFNILGLNSKPEEVGFSSSTDSGANQEELVMPYLKTLADFREVVRKEAIGIKASNILTECDRLRNEVLPELGVRLEDKENHTVIKLVGKEELKKEMEQLKLAEERKKAEKAKKKAEADAKQAEKEKQMRVNPKEMFQDPTKYSKFDVKV